MVRSASESAPADGPTLQDSGESPAVADSESLLSCLPEEWRAFGIEFDFTYTEIVCLMSTAPDQTRDDTVLSELISEARGVVRYLRLDAGAALSVRPGTQQSTTRSRCHVQQQTELRGRASRSAP